MNARIHISRTKLERSLSIVGAAAAGQSTVPLYTQVLFSFSEESGISLRATDQNTFIEGGPDGASGEGACQIAVDPKRLASILANLNGEEIAIEAKQAEGGALSLHFACGRQRASLPGFTGEDFTDMPEAAPIHRFVLPADDLREGLRRASHAHRRKAESETDKKWACLCVSASAGRLQLNTAEGARFAQILIPVDEYRHTPENVPSEGEGAKGKGKGKRTVQNDPLFHRNADATMIPLADVGKIARLLENAGDLPATLEIGWRMVTLEAGGYRAVLPVWDQPAFAAGILKLIAGRREGGFKTHAIVQRDDLARALRAAKSALPGEGLEHLTQDAVSLILWPSEDGESAELHVSTGDRGGNFYADVIPAQIDLADHLEALRSQYLADALAAVDSPKVLLRFAPATAHYGGTGESEYWPAPMFVEEYWEPTKDEPNPGAGRPEWLAVIQPLTQGRTQLFVQLAAEWERVTGRPYLWPVAPFSTEQDDYWWWLMTNDGEEAWEEGEAALPAPEPVTA